jgi:hypothetical protein
MLASGRDAWLMERCLAVGRGTWLEERCVALSERLSLGESLGSRTSAWLQAGCLAPKAVPDSMSLGEVFVSRSGAWRWL